MDDFRMALELARAAAEREKRTGREEALLTEICQLMKELVQLHRLTAGSAPTVWSAPNVAVGTSTLAMTGRIRY